MLGGHLCWFLVLTAVFAFSTGILSTSKSTTLYDQSIPVLVTARKYALQTHTITPKELIERHGYPFEEHEVVTEDGYILTLHRIPYGSNGPSANRMPIFVQHGLFSSSADWVVTGPNCGAGFILADAGFDVWLGNARGNTYSRKHKTLDPDLSTDKPKYWNFTFHKMGKYDLPSVIDYILQTTSCSQLFYLGHSMGAAMFYVMSSIRPEYNAKVKAVLSCGTAVYLQHMSSPARLVLTTAYGLRDTFDWLNIHEVFSQQQIVPLGLDVWCAQYSPLATFCATLSQLITGFNYKNYNLTAQAEILQNFPAGASTYSAFHLAQHTLFGLPFMPYIYGPLVEHDFDIPEPYPLSNVTVPVYMHTCTDDELTTPVDTYHLASELPNVVEVVTTKECNHLDYLFGIKTAGMYLNYCISVMKSLMYL